MRENPVPCKHATDYEINQDKHVTWNDNRICNPCRRTLDRFLSPTPYDQEVEEAVLDEDGPYHPSRG